MTLFDKEPPPGSIRALEMLCYIDGASRGNPGPAAFGAVVRWKAKETEFYGVLGTHTNNVAEYMGFISAALYAQAKRARALKVFSDSELIVKQLQGFYRVRSPKLLKLHSFAIGLLEPFENFEIRHIPRAENARADALANKALNLKKSSFPSDFPVERLPKP